MHHVHYRRFALVNTVPAEGTVVDLLFHIPYLIGFDRPFPPRDGLNDLLRHGFYDAGMSGGAEWDPFELSVDEYDEVVTAIKSDPRLAKMPADLDGRDHDQSRT
jgi:hypothetical protein